MDALPEVIGDDASTEWLDAVFVRFSFGKEPEAVDSSTLAVVAGERGVAMDALPEVIGDDASTDWLHAVFAVLHREGANPLWHTTAREAVDSSQFAVVAGERGVAMDALAEVNGDDASTEWLDAVFARFCIGKEPALAHHGRARWSTARSSRSSLVSAEWRWARSPK